MSGVELRPAVDDSDFQTTGGTRAFQVDPAIFSIAFCITQSLVPPLTPITLAAILSARNGW
jgi:hypothetical protein